MRTLKSHAIAVAITLGAVLVLIVAVAPSATAYPGNTGGVSLGSSTPTTGGSLTVAGTRCRPDSTVTMTLDTGAVLGTAPTDSNGKYNTTVTLPAGVTGTHTVDVSGAQCGATAAVTIETASSGGIGGNGNGSGGSGGGGGGGGGGLASTGVAILSLGGLGLLLLIGGGVVMLAGRRRKITT